MTYEFTGDRTGDGPQIAAELRQTPGVLAESVSDAPSKFAKPTGARGVYTDDRGVLRWIKDIEVKNSGTATGRLSTGAGRWRAKREHISLGRLTMKSHCVAWLEG